jgi:hypothetical protein
MWQVEMFSDIRNEFFIVLCARSDLSADNTCYNSRQTSVPFLSYLKSKRYVLLCIVLNLALSFIHVHVFVYKN